MRLVSATVNRIGRLSAAKINLDSKVIAIVGPNEAGKSTLLQALTLLEDSKPVPESMLTRGVALAPNDVVVSATYILDTEERGISVPYMSDPPQKITIEKRVDGMRALLFSPQPSKSRKLFKHWLSIINRFLKSPEGEAFQKIPRSADGESQDTPESRILELIEEFNRVARSENDDFDAEILKSGKSGYDRLRRRRLSEQKDFLSTISRIIHWVEMDPQVQMTSELVKRIPRFVFFDQGWRKLQSSFLLSDFAQSGLPESIKNVLNLSGLDEIQISSLLGGADRFTRKSILHQANKRLQERCKAAWRQSDIALQLDIYDDTLVVEILEGDTQLTPLEERSSGLQMFAALIAFVAPATFTVPPILLIDEAETHLHLNAQADLVSMFHSQDQAAKVIYTTHSPACLPTDLGTSIRSVVSNDEEPNRSVVHNSFWHKGAGFSPLMMAMGAAVAGFTPARLVLFAEGPSDMMLIPSLIRSATGENRLDYQVAPGLSTVNPDLYQDLDLEGARVTFLVDGDAGGEALQKKLTSKGIDPNRIVALGAPTLENLLDGASYFKCYRELLVECNPDKKIAELPSPPSLEDEPWANFIDRWARTENLTPPSKIAVANRLLETDSVKPSGKAIGILQDLHLKVLNALSLSTLTSGQSND
ncbi:AAA family ATPase [Nocardia grenadensis]